MRKDRLEMFSDGVFAIVITLLILDIRIPDVRASEIGPALYHLLPRVFTYVMSFFVVALYWLGHHRMSHLVRSVDGPFVWLNMLWLLFVSVIPFPTALLGRYPLEHIPIAVYGVDLILANITGFFVTLRLKDRPDLTTEPVGGSHIRSIIPAYIVTNGAYLIAIFIGGVLPIGSYAIYAGVLIWLAIRYSRSPHPFDRGARRKGN